ncbi:Cupredoxin [Lasiosphaeris hirsuta]|uniref:Cupredoxin n=1 Tax=Lasiosphaeris hirsuta TaxID=260670 RepID=A0AA40AP33_9PEZI|nr:Cupredoxin [Lasiosphaeris hirsuta]
MHITPLSAIATLVAHATAATIVVSVGQNGALAFSPSSVTASTGDIVEYHFFPPAHSVVMGDFNNACAPAITGGFSSGLISTSSGENANVFRVTVNSTNPIFFYCGVPGHCGAGMTGAINPSASQTLVMYQSKAQGATTSDPADGVFGGQLVAAGATATTAQPGESSTPGTSSGAGSIYGGPAGSGAGRVLGSVAGVLGVVLLML